MSAVCLNITNQSGKYIEHFMPREKAEGLKVDDVLYLAKKKYVVTDARPFGTTAIFLNVWQDPRPIR